MLYYYVLNEENKVVALLKQQPEGENFPTIELENPYIEMGVYEVDKGKLVYVGYSQEVLDEQLKEERIHRIKKLKRLLQESDWKVVVNSELIAAGLNAKYPDLHTERQAWRDEINELEEMLGIE